MNLEQKFEMCATFLNKWNDFLKLEPIRVHPNPFPIEMAEWAQELISMKTEDLVLLENCLSLKIDNKELQNFLSQISRITEFPLFSGNIQNLEQKISKKISEKKKHELERILSVTSELEDIHIVDIGGGAGYLTENLVYNKNRFSFCIDANKKLQERGSIRIHNNSIENRKKVKFIHSFFDHRFNSQSIKHDVDKLIIGLHSCGDLSSEIIKYFDQSNSKYLLNVGCCYQKLNNNYNISNFSKKHKIVFSENALNLASRCFSYQSKEKLEKKIKVRTYRYALHFYLQKKGIKSFTPIGRTQLSDYKKPFSDYVKKYTPQYFTTSEHAESFFNSPQIQDLVSQTIHIDLLRGLLGRVIETYIVLDRALFLKERNYNVSIQTIFDRKLSPRNLAIIVQN